METPVENIAAPPPKRRRRWLPAAAAALLLLLAALWGVHTYNARYLTLDGQRYSRDARSLDLRELALTAEDFERYRAAFPQAELRWTVPLSGGGRDSESQVVELSALREEDIPLFAYFPRLRAVRADACTDYAALLRLREALPGRTVTWRVELAGRHFRESDTVLLLPAGASAEEILEKLPYLPEAEELRFTGGAVAWETQDAITAQWPELRCRWDTRLLDKTVPAGAQSLSYAGETLTEADVQTLRDNLRRVPSLLELDLTGCGLAEETLAALAAELPGITVVRELELYGVTVSTGERELDFSGRRIWDGAAALEEALPLFPRLEKVIMSRCGISNEDMDALDRRHADVRFVWTVFFSIYSMRTDETNFIAARFVNDAELYSEQCRVLRYCTDLQALDLGHKNITDLSFLYDLPRLKYLILVENDLYDITPIGSLKELKYLEIFWTKVEDISPLIGCTALEDLNICYIYAKPDRAFETLMQMPWLQRLWYCGNALKEEQIQALRDNMPLCEMYLELRGESTGGTWREHPHYYEMRDFFNMYYMKGGTNGVDENGRQVVVNG